MVIKNGNKKLSMKNIIIYTLFSLIVTISCSSNQVSKVWMTEYQGDSVISERFLIEINFTKNGTNYKYHFDEKSDTTEIIITHLDRNRNDSVQIWKYPNHDNSMVFCKTYNENNQISESWVDSPFSDFIDTVYYIYDNVGNLSKRIDKKENSYSFDTLIYRNNTLQEKVNISSKGVVWRKERYLYSANNLLEKSVLLDEKDKVIRTIEYEYTNNNKLAQSREKLFTKDTINGELVFFKTFEYYLNDTLKIVNIIKYLKDSDVKLFYDKNGILVKKETTSLSINRKYIEEYEYLP